MTVVGLARKPS